jgi:uncharacterized protein with NAD-binding domain and iron-sulfur cluster
VLYDAGNRAVTGFELTDGSVVRGDAYVSAMPVHNLWKTLPTELREQEPFSGLRRLHGVPVMTVQLYFDRPVTGVDNLIFSSGTHISVYAELGRICPDYRTMAAPGDGSAGVGGWGLGDGPSAGSPNPNPQPLSPRSMVELVVAPAAVWFKLSDEDVVARVMEEFVALHPGAAGARLLKSTVVRIPQSVYRARPGMDRYRPDQATPVPNFFLCGDYTRQDYLASMEGAVISGRRAAQRVAGSRLQVQGNRLQVTGYESPNDDLKPGTFSAERSTVSPVREESEEVPVGA